MSANNIRAMEGRKEKGRYVAKGHCARWDWMLWSAAKTWAGIQKRHPGGLWWISILVDCSLSVSCWKRPVAECYWHQRKCLNPLENPDGANNWPTMARIWMILLSHRIELLMKVCEWICFESFTRGFFSLARKGQRSLANDRGSGKNRTGAFLEVVHSAQKVMGYLLLTLFESLFFVC